MAAQSTPRRDPGPRKKSRKALYVLLALLGVAGIGAALHLKNKNRGKVPVVTIVKSASRTITQTVSATGKIQPAIEVKISPEVAGEVLELPFREGARVRKGDLLVRIKSDNYQFQVEQREADLSAAKAGSLESRVRLLKAEDDHRRARELFEQRLVSEADLTASRTTAEAARAGYENSLAQIRRAEGLLKQSQDQLEKTTIDAPMDGTVSILSTEVGERVVATGQFSGTEVMRIADLSEMEVRVNVNENDIVNVKPGDRTRITIDAFPRRNFEGEVTEIASAARTTGQNTQEEITNFLVKIRLADPGVPIRPGMSANAEIETRTVEDIVAVPIQSVTVRSREGAKTMDQVTAAREKLARESAGEGSAIAVDERRRREREQADRESLRRVVFVVEGGVVRMVPVETGIADTTHMEITAGLEPGVEVVSGSFGVITRTLEDGMKIRIDKPKGAGGAK